MTPPMFNMVTRLNWIWSNRYFLKKEIVFKKKRGILVLAGGGTGEPAHRPPVGPHPPEGGQGPAPGRLAAPHDRDAVAGHPGQLPGAGGRVHVPVPRGPGGAAGAPEGAGHPPRQAGGGRLPAAGDEPARLELLEVVGDRRAGHVHHGRKVDDTFFAMAQ